MYDVAAVFVLAFEPQKTPNGFFVGGGFGLRTRSSGDGATWGSCRRPPCRGCACRDWRTCRCAACRCAARGCSRQFAAIGASCELSAAADFHSPSRFYSSAFLQGSRRLSALVAELRRLLGVGVQLRLVAVLRAHL